MNKPKISVVFTSYNHKEYLEDALLGILNQSFTDFELIIVDDCSTDGSQEIIKKYDNDARIKLHLLQKNSGSYVNSSNYGARQATADLLIFAQCDDIAYACQLEKLYAAFTQNPTAGVFFSSSDLIDHRGKFMCNDFKFREKKFKTRCQTDTLLYKNEVQDFLLYSCIIPNLSAALIKKTVYEFSGGLSPKYLVLADWDFWLRAALITDFYYIRKPLNNFRQHKTTIRNSVKIIKQITEFFEMYYSFFEKAGIQFPKRLNYEINLANAWLGFILKAPKAWFAAFFTILFRSVSYSFYFPLVIFVAACYYPFSLLIRLVRKVFVLNQANFN